MRLAVVDHSFHQKTKSNEFFFAIAEECGTVDRFYCDQWQGGKSVDTWWLGDGKYDAVIFFQQIYPPRQLLNACDAKKIILVPMLDAVVHWSTTTWQAYRNFRFVSFSNTLHETLRAAGCSSTRVIYFPECDGTPTTVAAEADSAPSVFFWQRTRDITWNVVKALIGDTPVRKVVLKACPDPFGESEGASHEDVRRFRMEEVGWMASREDYLRKVAQCEFFIAPRRYEGIGLSFLEAMALGNIVVAPDLPTMNEYITHGRNGLLYHLDNPQPCLSAVPRQDIRKRVVADAQMFSQQWAHSRSLIKQAILDAANEERRRRVGAKFKRLFGRI